MRGRGRAGKVRGGAFEGPGRGGAGHAGPHVWLQGITAGGPLEQVWQQLVGGAEADCSGGRARRTSEGSRTGKVVPKFCLSNVKDGAATKRGGEHTHSAGASGNKRLSVWNILGRRQGAEHMDLELRKVWEDTGATVLGGGGTERGQRGGAVAGAQAQSVTGSRRLLAPVPTGNSVLRDLEVTWGSFQTPRTSCSQVPCRSTLLPPAVTSLRAQMLPSLQGLVAPQPMRLSLPGSTVLHSQPPSAGVKGERSGRRHAEGEMGCTKLEVGVARGAAKLRKRNSS